MVANWSGGGNMYLHWERLAAMHYVNIAVLRELHPEVINLPFAPSEPITRLLFSSNQERHN